VLNSGHRADEIELAPLIETPTERLLPHVTTHALPNGRKIHLFAGGAMANLTAGEGDSLNAFDITLAVMTAGIAHIVGEGERSPAGVHILPKEVWSRVCPQA
jgi:adenosylhomocysteinase